MSIDIFSVEPNRISRDMREKIVAIYGQPKSGKTTTASQFPNALLLAAEKGYNALPGVRAVDIMKWADVKKVLKQLSKPQAKEMYETIVIDTADIFYNMCEKYIINREGVSKIGDIPYGGGYKMVRTEYEDALRSIPQMGYGIVMISHAQDATLTDDQGREYSKTIPTLPKSARQVVLSMADVIAYAKPVEEEGEQVVKAFLRGTPQFEAGSRFKYTPPVINFNYDELVEAIANAIEKEEEERTGSVSDEPSNAYKPVEQRPFEEMKDDANQVINELMADLNEEQQATLAQRIKKIVEEHLGKGRYLAETEEEQYEQVEMILLDLQELQENLSD